MPETFEFDPENERMGVLIPGKMPLVIHKKDLDISYFSGGPGGQNVNRNMNGVRLIYRIPRTHLLPFKRTKELIAKSIAQRSREQNFKQAFADLAQKMAEYFYVAPPRHKTKVPKASKRRRLEDKKKNSQLKSQRKKVDF